MSIIVQRLRREETKYSRPLAVDSVLADFGLPTLYAYHIPKSSSIILVL